MFIRMLLLVTILYKLRRLCGSLAAASSGRFNAQPFKSAFIITVLIHKINKHMPGSDVQRVQSFILKNAGFNYLSNGT